MNGLWNFVQDRNIKIEFNNLPNHLKCCICNEILKNAVHSKCGCRFCHNCIRDLFPDSSDNSKLCPGCLKENEEIEIKFETDISSDPAVTKEILKLDVNCPHEECNELMKAGDLYEHLIKCNKTKIPCIFNAIGAHCNNIPNDELLSHYEQKSLEHNKITVDFIVHLQSDQRDILNELNILKEENCHLKDELESKGVKIKIVEEELTKKNNELMQLQNDLIQLSTRVNQLENVTEYFWTFNQISKLEIDPLERYSSGIFKLRGYRMSMHLFRKSAHEIRICPCLEPVPYAELSKSNSNDLDLTWPIPFTLSVAILNPWEGTVKKKSLCSNKPPYICTESIEKPRKHRQRLSSSPKTLIYLDEAALEVNFSVDLNCKFHNSILIRCSLDRF